MPIPAPAKGEGSQDFIGRCMGDDTMRSEYTDQKQRSAVCHSSLRKKRGKKTLLTS